jgi:hypothetical protein
VVHGWKVVVLAYLNFLITVGSTINIFEFLSIFAKNSCLFGSRVFSPYPLRSGIFRSYFGSFIESSESDRKVTTKVVVYNVVSDLCPTEFQNVFVFKIWLCIV